MNITKQNTSPSTIHLLRVSNASQAAVTRMVGDGVLSMQAAFITNYIINKSVARLMGACTAPASEIIRAMGISNQAVGYKYVNEAIDAGLLQAFKASGFATVYRPRYDNILNTFEADVIGSDFWLEQARVIRKQESAQIMQTMMNCNEDCSQESQGKGGY